MCRKIYLNEFVDLLNNGMHEVMVGMFRSKWFVVLCVMIWLMPVTAWSGPPPILPFTSVTFR